MNFISHYPNFEIPSQYAKEMCLDFAPLLKLSLDVVQPIFNVQETLETDVLTYVDSNIVYGETIYSTSDSTWLKILLQINKVSHLRAVLTITKIVIPVWVSLYIIPIVNVRSSGHIKINIGPRAYISINVEPLWRVWRHKQVDSFWFVPCCVNLLFTIWMTWSGVMV